MDRLPPELKLHVAGAVRLLLPSLRNFLTWRLGEQRVAGSYASLITGQPSVESDRRAHSL